MIKKTSPHGFKFFKTVGEVQEWQRWALETVQGLYKDLQRPCDYLSRVGVFSNLSNRGVTDDQIEAGQRILAALGRVEKELQVIEKELRRLRNGPAVRFKKSAD